MLPRPVIIDSVVAKKLLNNIGYGPDFSIYMFHDYDYDDWLSPIVKDYENEFEPKTKSDLAIELHFD